MKLTGKTFLVLRKISISNMACSFYFYASKNPEKCIALNIN